MINKKLFHLTPPPFCCELESELLAIQSVAEERAGEKLLVSEMIALYCRKNHHTAKGSLCPQCQALHDYALQRIERCPLYGNQNLLLRLQSTLLQARNA